MNNKSPSYIKGICMFVCIILFGTLYINLSSLGYDVSAILYGFAVIGAM